MLSRAIFNALAIFASTAAAGPTWHASRGEDLVKFLERATAPTLNFHISSNASIITPDSPEWVDDTTRWSTWSAPTFSVAFLPAEEKDVSVGVSGLNSSRTGEIIYLRYLYKLTPLCSSNT